MRLVITNELGNFDIDISEQNEIQEIVEIARRHYNLPANGYYTIGIKNHIYLEFLGAQKIVNTCIKENDTLIFNVYTKTWKKLINLLGG